MEPIGETLKHAPHVRALNKMQASRAQATDLNAYPLWYRNTAAARYPDECRARCMECRGWRTRLAFEVRDCVICHKGMGPCSLHGCRMCNGTGLVCPGCRGMRWIRTGNGHSPIGGNSGVKHCDACMEGNNVNDDREGRVIAQYLATGDKGGRWIKLAPEALSERRMMKIREEREKAEAYHREWASIYITAKQQAMERRSQEIAANNQTLAARGIVPLSGPELLKLAPEQGKKPRKREAQ